VLCLVAAACDDSTLTPDVGANRGHRNAELRASIAGQTSGGWQDGCDGRCGAGAHTLLAQAAQVVERPGCSGYHDAASVGSVSQAGTGVRVRPVRLWQQACARACVAPPGKQAWCGRRDAGVLARAMKRADRWRRRIDGGGRWFCCGQRRTTAGGRSRRIDREHASTVRRRRSAVRATDKTWQWFSLNTQCRDGSAAGFSVNLNSGSKVVIFAGRRRLPRRDLFFQSCQHRI
jgi:hypothetical protein